MLGFLRIILPLLTVFLFPALLLAQENKTISHAYLKPQAKIVLLNPGFEWEIPHSFRNSINTHIGIGYGGSYPELTTRYETGLQALIAPFLDVQHRTYLNLKRRIRKEKNTENNSGSFVVVRCLVRGGAFESTFYRTSDVDFGLGVGWGFQRSRKNFNLSFSISPYFYFDDKGNTGFLPFIPEINIGCLLKGRRNT